MRAPIGSYLVRAAILATACGTQSPASPTAAILHGGDHGGSSHGGGDHGGGNSGPNDGSNRGGDDGGAAAIHENEFNGLVTAVGSNSITVARQKILIDSNTRITSEDKTLTLADIKVGNRVEVKATVSGTTVTATRIQVEDAADEPGDDEARPGASS